MRELKSKQNFIAQVEREIEVRENLISWYEQVFLPTLKKFDGKVYSKRFITALDNQKEDLMSIRPLEYDHIVIEGYHRKMNYVDRECLYAMVKLDNEGRIDYNTSINDGIGKKWIEGFIQTTEELKQAIEKYDEYIKIAKDLANKLEEYSKLNYRFRKNIKFINKFYLG